MASCCGRPSVWECVLTLGWPTSRQESRWRKVRMERCRPGALHSFFSFSLTSCPLVARLQDGLSSALSRRRVQSDAALLAVQPRRTTKVLRSAARPRCHQKEVMAAVLSPLNGRDALKNKRWWHHAPSHQECRCHRSGRQQRFRTVSFLGLCRCGCAQHLLLLHKTMTLSLKSANNPETKVLSWWWCHHCAVSISV